MKRIITIAAIIMAVIPAAASAQTYTLLDNYNKAELMGLVEDAINAGTVTFDTQAHKNEFLALISDLYDARDAENWGECVSILEDIESAAANITNLTHENTVKCMCNVLELGFSSYNGILALHNAQLKILEGILNDPTPPPAEEPEPQASNYHVESPNKQGISDPWDCFNFPCGNAQTCHLDPCDMIMFVDIKR